MKPTKIVPRKWHEVYRSDAEKKLFVGKDGKSGLCRSLFHWRTTAVLSEEAGLTEQQTEAILDHYCQRGIVIRHANDPNKPCRCPGCGQAVQADQWAYWENVTSAKD